jgi:hypothetical protein
MSNNKQTSERKRRLETGFHLTPEHPPTNQLKPGRRKTTKAEIEIKKENSHRQLCCTPKAMSTSLLLKMKRKQQVKGLEWEAKV